MLSQQTIKLLCSLAFIFFAFTARATNYYLSNAGNDANSGTDPSSPWQTLNKLNSFNNLKPGDNVLFKRGDTWREALMIPSGGTPNNPIVFSAYGTGEKPRILGSELEMAWIKVSGNIWESSSTFTDPYAVSSYHANIYFIETNGSVSWGRVKKSNTSSCVTEYDWTWASNHIYIYSPSDPNTRYARVEITQRNIGIRLLSKEYVTIDGLEIAYAGHYGIAESGSESNLNGLTIKNCHIHHIGIKTSGFGIESFYSNTLIQNNEIDNSGRRNISLNLYEGTAMHNVIVEGNTLHNSFHTTGVDISSSGSGTIDSVAIFGNYIHDSITSDVDNVETYGSTLVYVANDGSGRVGRIYIHNNLLKNNTGWAINLGAIGGPTSCYIYNNTIYGVSPHITSTYKEMVLVETGSNCVIKNNIFYNNVDISTNPTYSVIGVTADAGTVVLDNNLYYNTSATRLIAWYGTTYSTSQFSSYQSATGQDLHSLVNIDPLFVSSSNYHLQSASPAISAGKDVGLPYKGRAPDLGLYESSFNLPPTANAGSNQTITLPTNTVSLSASGSDADGTISSYSWTKVSGPNSGTIINANAASAIVNNLSQGVYQFELKVTDDKGAVGKDTVQVTVNTAPNMPPTANAGKDQTITLPTNTVSLSGNGTDADGTISSYAWTKISGPSGGTINNANFASAIMNNLSEGVYLFELKVTDDKGAVGKDTVQITVNAAPNMPPTANAGKDQTITLPANSVSFSGNGTDADGTISSYAWTKISGPSGEIINNANSASAIANNLSEGVYQFELQVTDDKGAVGKDTVQITVNTAPNMPPTANAGKDQTITLPTNTVSLSGNGTDADGTISSYAWTKISGASGETINNANSASAIANNLSEGVYQFELTGN